MGARKQKEGLRLLRGSEKEQERQRVLREALGWILQGEKAEAAAEALLEAFGSFTGIFSAPVQELERVLGDQERAAAFLRLITDCARLYMEDSADTLRRIYDTKSAYEAFQPKFLGRKTEAVALMLLDGKGQILFHQIISEGSVTAVPVYIRRILELAIGYHVQTVMLAHNHPSGNSLPSKNDIVATRQIEMALESIDAQLADHLILTDRDYYSFSTSGLLDVVQEQVHSVRRLKLKRARELEAARFPRDADPRNQPKGKK